MPWFRGNLHCHSSRSDGRATPANVGRFYALAGHAFLGLSDHNRLTPPEQAGGAAGLLGIPCCEYTGEACCHVLGVGVTAPAAPAPSRRRKARAKTVILQDGIDRTRAVGGIPVVCHPAWNWTFDYEEMAALKRCNHFELCNASPDCNAHPVPGFEPMDALWDRLLTSGRRYYGLANDDAHEYYIPFAPRQPLGGLGYNVVKVPALTVRHVVDAIRHGRFYASTGVELSRYRVTRQGIRLSVAVRQRERTVIQFFGTGGRELRRVVGEEAAYRFRGDEGYVRARVASTAGLWAWTQPVFLDDLADAVRWTALR